MGGCRCTFRTCENSTALRPGMHFFHFPIRDWPRLEKWAINADKRDFKMLPLSKLKNKVVCEEHFRNDMFMNFLKESLTKMAVPTLAVLEDGRVWDVETNEIGEREEWVVPQTLKKATSSKRDMLVLNNDSDNTTMQIQFLESDEFPQEEERPPALLNLNNPPKLLNKEAANINIFIPTDSPNKKTLTSTVLRKVQLKRKSFPIREIDVQPEETAQDQPAAAMPSSSTDEPPVTVTQQDQVLPAVVGMHPTYLQKLKANSQQIAEVKKLLEDVLSRPIPEPRVVTVEVPTPILPPPTVDNGCDKLEKGANMNKAQLFNGIKRYLNPTMVALLRMEMFGGPTERQWKPDEKALAVELIGLGENVYDHFCDEFRFRLPCKKDVQQWKQQELHDDDAS
ncbi:uncharacterized protein LOC129730600 isoform X2 [Wyeomyia smithii]|uniref:uncharacterized protein LOC129730600 isoform X2 n=1 Tax=Wyeomyia smithii TaxID=174621 RepID=UPI002467C7F4|nr:uncharacterized protein LOC129730600 isoform X2 [Wyeomyia smithii]